MYRAKRILGMLVLSSSLLLGCGDSDTTNRGKFKLPAGAKADDPIYSCKGSCGDMAPGGCWCDELCTTFNDCCADVKTACAQPTPPPPTWCSKGTVDPGTPTYVDSTDGMKCEIAKPVCLTTDSGACPQLAPLPPDWCKNGDVVQGEPTYVDSTDGMKCKLPTPVCVTKDATACPQLAPLPPDWCKNGKVVQGAPKFIDSTDGMKCQLPTPICLTTDPTACPQP
jgi:hypothetical protein